MRGAVAERKLPVGPTSAVWGDSCKEKQYVYETMDLALFARISN